MPTFLHLQGLPAPIRFCQGSGDVATTLLRVLKGWPSRLETRSARTGSVFLHIRKAGDFYVVRRPGDNWRAVEPNAISAACAAILELVDGYVADRRRLGLLHAGSAEFAERLVLFPATNRAGKSTLMTRLAAAGHKVFSDDLIPLDFATGEATATGCLPRPRLPLPAGVSSDFADFVVDRTVAADEHYAYVDPGETGRAGFGERRRLGAVVLLHRSSEAAPARLEPATTEEALWALLSQDTRRGYPAEETLEDYLNIVGKLRCFQMHYSDLENAVLCLEEAFSAWEEGTAPGIDSPQGEPGLSALPSLASSDEGARYRRARHVTLKAVGQAGFLIDHRNEEIHHLNAMGLAIWRLLDGRVCEKTIAGLFSEAFPDTTAGTIADDVEAVIDGLLEAGLIEEA